jgi:branched-chain amino acid aminotransferase, group II
MELKITLTNTPKAKPADESKLGFGKVFTDHMLVVDYEEGKGWHNAEIKPFGDIPLSPAATALHYSQEVFEGMKAYRGVDGSIRLFRPEKNFERLNRSAVRISMPQLDEEFLLSSLKKLIEIDADWVPHSDGASLYIRPFIIGCEDFLGVHPASKLKYIVILSPSGAYYAGGLAPVQIYIEDEYVRAVRGGTGEAKTGGNYAASLLAGEIAAKKGFAQVLWLDGIERKYIEEVGAMNVFFKIGDTVVTPALTGSILPGITRMSVIELLKARGVKVEERKLSIDEVVAAYDAGTLSEVFGTGTAAVISPVGRIVYGGKDMALSGGAIGELSQELYDELTGIQWGKRDDAFGWTSEVC